MSNATENERVGIPEPDAPSDITGGDRLAAAARTLPRRRFWNDMPDKGLFALVALGGFLGIIVLKTNTSLASEPIAGMAVTSMILYGVIAFRLPAVQMRPDRLGDNFYYLGFIFTLASLSAALMQLRSAPNIEDLLGNFGIALITTVVGVAGRVLFVQMRGEIDDIEARVRRDLASASADLRAQLVLSLREFETFQTGVLQAASEAVARLTKEADARVKEAVGEIGSEAQALSTSVRKVNEAISELPLMGKMELPNERLERQIAAFVEELRSLIEQLGFVTNVVRRRGSNRRRKWYWLFLR